MEKIIYIHTNTYKYNLISNLNNDHSYNHFCVAKTSTVCDAVGNQSKPATAAQISMYYVAQNAE